MRNQEWHPGHPHPIALRDGVGKGLDVSIGNSVVQVLWSGSDEDLDVCRLAGRPRLHPLTYQTFIEHLLWSRHYARFWKYMADQGRSGPLGG